MIKLAICDDNQEQLKHNRDVFIQAAAKYSPEIELFSSGEELIKAIERASYAPNVVVLDIVKCPPSQDRKK